MFYRRLFLTFKRTAPRSQDKYDCTQQKTSSRHGVSDRPPKREPVHVSDSFIRNRRSSEAYVLQNERIIASLYLLPFVYLIGIITKLQIPAQMPKGLLRKTGNRCNLPLILLAMPGAKSPAFAQIRQSGASRWARGACPQGSSCKSMHLDIAARRLFLPRA